MNERVWQDLVRSAVVGTERSPLPADLTAAFDLPPQEDAALRLLHALTAATAIRKVARRTGADLASLPPSVCGGKNEPQLPPVPAPPQGRYEVLLEEWLDLLNRCGRSVPPELLPDLLQRAERDPDFWEKLRPALGERGLWLMRQNAAWQTLLTPAVESADWFTADFSTRLRLLQAARHQRPLVALSWLESTWAQERAEHRVAFLRTLRTRLSVLDEDFLEKNLAAKSLEVRREAADLLACLPDGKSRAAWTDLAVSLRDFVQAGNLSAFLAERIPDLEAPVAAQLFSLTSGKAVQSARMEILQTLLFLLPPSAWGFEQPLATLRLLQADALLQWALVPLVVAITAHADETWSAALEQFLMEQRDHPLWQSRVLVDFLVQRDSPELMGHLARLPQQMIELDTTFQRVLAARPRYWPPLLLQAVLEVWAAAASEGTVYPPAGMRKVLDQVALYAPPELALAASQRWAGREGSWQGGWRTSWLDFLAVLRYRVALAERVRPLAT